MSKEDGRVIPMPERLYSLGPGLAGIVDKEDSAFEIWNGGSGDIFVALGKFGPPGCVERDNQVLFDFPSVINGGGRHPNTSLALNTLRKTIITYGQRPLSSVERIIEPDFRADFITINGNELTISFTPFYRPNPNLTIHATDCHWVRGKQTHNWARLFEREESQREFGGIINAFRRLAEAIQKDGGRALLL